MKEAELQSMLRDSQGKERIKVLIKYSEFLRQSGDRRSITFAEEARQIALANENDDEEIAALVCIAYAHFYLSEFEEAKKFTHELLQRGLKINDPETLGTSYNIRARIAYKSENPGKALELFLKALEYYLQKPQGWNLMSCYNNLGMCHLHLGNTEEAYNYYQLALEQAEKLNHPARETILMNIGNIHYNREEFDQALKYYKRAETMFRENNLVVNLGNVCYNLGLVYHQLGDREQSMTYFEKSYKLQKEINDPKGLSTSCVTIGSELLHLGRYDESYRYLQESLRISEENNLKWNLLETSEAFARYWHYKGNFEEKSKYLEQVITLTSELNKELNREQLSEMEAKYKTQIYMLRSQELDAENKSMSEQIVRLKEAMEGLRDIHEQLKQEFQQAVTKINEQDNLLSTQSRMAVMGEMVSIIAHQWRQPLNIIGLLVQSFQDAWEFNEISGEFIDEQVKIVMEQIQYMSETITDFRDFFKTEYVNDFKLEDVISRSLQLLDYSLKKARIEVETEFEGDCRIGGNPNEIVQVLLNIINNAREAMQENKIPEPLIRIRLSLEQENIFIRIFNKGNLLSEEVRNKLFEPYFTTKSNEGTGIGLYICRKIIENKYQGKFDVECREDGVEFAISLPAEILK
ncbi:MAG: tetratricopeptide repeat-containing sensor histidine kinase [Candidatus Cloacimonetes bacterium]|nr:tetratricopeptide repeat-containing sensor histidine kinase [Candidatus Cloacimonadota bacterium]